jgi:formylglycine-generating enzyme required for sulfatase activity
MREHECRISIPYAHLNPALAVLCGLFLVGCAGMALTDFQSEKQPIAPERKTLTVDLGGGVTMVLVFIPPGTFTMGSTGEELAAVRREWPEVKEHWVSNELPAHEVTIPGSFYMGRYEVTQEQWEAVMGSNPSIFKGPKKAVQASWYDCQEFLKRLNEKTGRRFALPSEAEWEYACRAGTTTRFYFGESARPLRRYEWTWSYHGRVRPVGQKRPNPWGLYDIQGNVAEWCEDVWHKSYEGAPCDGSPWLEGGDRDFRVLRGGCWDSAPYHCRSAHRFMYFPHLRACSGIGGLRVVLRDF